MHQHVNTPAYEKKINMISLILFYNSDTNLPSNFFIIREIIANMTKIVDNNEIFDIFYGIDPKIAYIYDIISKKPEKIPISHGSVNWNKNTNKIHLFQSIFLYGANWQQISLELFGKTNHNDICRQAWLRLKYTPPKIDNTIESPCNYQVLSIFSRMLLTNTKNKLIENYIKVLSIYQKQTIIETYFSAFFYGYLKGKSVYLFSLIKEFFSPEYTAHYIEGYLKNQPEDSPTFLFFIGITKKHFAFEFEIYLDSFY